VGFVSLQAGSPINNQEIEQIKVEIAAVDYFLIAAKNGTGNLNIYKINGATKTIDDQYTDAITLLGHTSITDISISQGAGDEIYIGAISTTIGGLRDLALVKFDSSDPSISDNLSEIESVSAVGFEKYVEDLDRVKVIGNINTPDSVLVALTTNSFAPVDANSAYTIKVSTAAGGFNFQEYNYPKLNIDNITSGSAISTTPITNLTLIGNGDLTIPVAYNAAYVPIAAQTGTIQASFVSIHESNSGNKIRSFMLNTQDSTVYSNATTAGSGSAAGMIGNN